MVGLAYKSAVTGKKVSISKDEFTEATWLRVARGWQLKLSLKAGGYATFDGFKNSDKVTITEFSAEHFKEVDIEEETQAGSAPSRPPPPPPSCVRLFACLFARLLVFTGTWLHGTQLHTPTGARHRCGV